MESDQHGAHDFGHHVLPRLLTQVSRLFAYDFDSNCVPGVQPHEEPSYWRDVGTLEAYATARNDMLGHKPRFELRNAAWPIHPCDREAMQDQTRQAVTNARHLNHAKGSLPRETLLDGRGSKEAVPALQSSGPGANCSRRRWAWRWRWAVHW